jgi:hypothetical protein
MRRPWAVDSWGKEGAGDSSFYGVWEKQPREVPVEVKTSGTPTVQAAGKGNIIEPKPTTNVFN